MTRTTAIIIMQRTFRWLAATNDHPVVTRWTSASLAHHVSMVGQCVLVLLSCRRRRVLLHWVDKCAGEWDGPVLRPMQRKWLNSLSRGSLGAVQWCCWWSARQEIILEENRSTNNSGKSTVRKKTHFYGWECVLFIVCRGAVILSNE